MIVSDFQNDDKRKFWKVIRHFVKSNSSVSPIPPLCSTLQNGNNQCHFNDIDKAMKNDEHTQLPSFSKLTDNSLSQI